ncbi:MAG: hypothetical protein QOI04_57 [Verrucomicrobiota bacterium]|jgi:hypothetical protein
MENLPSYLNDHLAGAVAALELLDHLIKTHQGKPLASFFKELRDDIEADQKVLREVLRTFEVKESLVRKAGAWIAEKLGRTKIEVAGEKIGEIGLMQALEALVLGITGKQLLWRALGAASETSSRLQNIDLGKLEERAIEQVERVEAKRLDAARAAFRST